jgi:Tol biopolymer transport system component
MWSPDSKYFAYRDGASNYSPAQLYLQPTFAGEVSTVSLIQPPLQVIELRWSPDSTWIVFAARSIPPRNLYDSFSQLYRVNVNQSGSPPERLTSESYLVHYAPVWSPDGEQLAYLVTDGSGYVQLMQMTLATLEVHQLTDIAFKEVRNPAWSPDGQMIAFTASDPYQDSGLYLIQPDGTELRQLTTQLSYVISPAWRPQ